LNKPNFLTLKKALFALLTAVAITACTKEPALLGLNLTPNGDKINVFFNDTTTLNAFNYPKDTLRTSVLPGYTGSTLNTILLGSMYDSTFGKIEASFATQLWLGSTSPSYSGTAVTDSIILQLPYAGLYGDSLSQHHLKIYQLLNPLRGDSMYYNNTPITPLANSQIADLTFVPDVKDSVTISSVKYEPMLRMRINNSFGDMLLKNSKQLTTEINFRKIVKGLYFTEPQRTTKGDGSIITFDLTGTYSSLTVYYHDSLNASYTMSMSVDGTNSQRFNNLNFNNYQFADPLLRAQVINKDSTKGQQLLFLNGMSSSDIKITFPHILNYLKQNKAGFNEAYLVIDAPYKLSNKKPPSLLSLYKIYKDGKSYQVEDQTTSTPSAIAGTYDTTKMQYRFTITTYIQNILKTGKQDYYLMLGIANPGKNATELIIPGTSKAIKKRLRLELIYTTPK
jgi:hypothetical protein